MKRSDNKKRRAETTDMQSSCCKVLSMISVDERGQMVLPKDVREMANIKAGDKLALVSWFKNGRMCCLSLVKADDLTEMVKGTLGPVMRDLL